ncbi:MAG: HipA domain-containing protein [Fuerstiella sp.]
MPSAKSKPGCVPSFELHVGSGEPHGACRDFSAPTAASVLPLTDCGIEPRKNLEQQLLRAVFNVFARNQDEHVKNVAFLMGKAGEWRMAVAICV